MFLYWPRSIIPVLDDTQTSSDNMDKAAKMVELRSLCHPGKQVWKEDPAVCIRSMRANDRI